MFEIRKQEGIHYPSAINEEESYAAMKTPVLPELDTSHLLASWDVSKTSLDSSSDPVSFVSSVASTSLERTLSSVYSLNLASERHRKRAD